MARRAAWPGQLHRIAGAAGLKGAQVGDLAGHWRVGAEPLPLLFCGLAQCGELVALCLGLFGSGRIGPAHIATQAGSIHELPRTIATALHLIGRAPETLNGMDDPDSVAEGPDFIAPAFVDDVRPAVRRVIQASHVRPQQFQCRSAAHLIPSQVSWLRLCREAGFLRICNHRVQSDVQLGQAAQRLERIGEHLANPGIVIGGAG